MNTLPIPERELPQQEHLLFEHSSGILSMRYEGKTWKEISETTGYSRLQAMQLAHTIFELVDALAKTKRHHTIYQKTA